MRRRLAILFMSAAAAAALVPTLAAHASTSATLPPACVVIHGPQGLTVQVGYAPDGPTTCRQVNG
jgi:hypothetical protein